MHNIKRKHRLQQDKAKVARLDREIDKLMERHSIGNKIAREIIGSLQEARDQTARRVKALENSVA